MNAFSNSLFFTADLGLLRFYLQQAVVNSSSKSLKELDFTESQKLVKDYVIPAVQQTVQDYSNAGNWKDEKDYALLRIHGLFFLSWMTTTLENTCEIFVPVGSVFYLQIIKMCSFENFLLQCLCNVSEETAEVLIQSIAQSSKVWGEEEVKNLSLYLVEQCLLQLGSFEGRYGKMSDAKLCHVLIQIVRNVEQHLLQADILSKLADQLHKHLSQLRVSSNHACNSFTQKLNIIEFNEKIREFTREVKKPIAAQKPFAVKLVEVNTNESLLKQPAKAILCFVSCVKQIITVEWRSLFIKLNNVELLGKTVTCMISNWDDVLFDVFTACKSLQSLTADKTTCNELQAIIDLLHPYFDQHVTFKERRLYIENTSNDARIECRNHENEFGMINGTLDEKLQHALFQIKENLFGDEMCFEWLLLTEDLYVDERWLNCVMTHAKSFVSIKTIKMLLDILSILQEFDIMQEGVHSNIYTSLKKVLLDLIPYLSLPEQKEVMLYNFDLVCLHFECYQHHSFFVFPGDQSGPCLIKEILTATLNKIVNRSGTAGFTKDVTDGIIQSCLISSYLTLKELLNEAVKHNGFDSVICQLFQTIPWLVTLAHNNDDSLIIQVLREIMSSLTSKKQEEQISKLVEKLMQPYVHPDFETKEPALVPAAKIYQGLVMPFVTSGGDDVSILVLDILMKSLSCSLNSKEQLPHWIMTQQPLQLLFILLEMYEECEQFWEDWLAASSENSVQRNDGALDQAWDEMNVILKIVEEYLVPLLKEDIHREPARYYGNISWIKDHLHQQDWVTSMLIIPLLQCDVFNECIIKLPEPMKKLMCGHFNAVPFKDEGSVQSFWAMYFKACAVSNEVCGIYLSKLKEMHPRENEANINDNEEIIHDLAQLLPFSSWKQWRRILNIALELVKYGYLMLPWEWKAELTDLPDIFRLDHHVIKTSELLVLILLEIQNKHWATSYVWSITLKNYVSKMREVSLEIVKEDKFQVCCHLLAHLAHAAFKIVPEGFQENVTILLLDIFNQCLICVSTEDIDMSTKYLQGIVNMISSNGLKLTMASKVNKMLSNNASK